MRIRQSKRWISSKRFKQCWIQMNMFLLWFTELNLVIRSVSKVFLAICNLQKINIPSTLRKRCVMIALMSLNHSMLWRMLFGKALFTERTQVSISRSKTKSLMLKTFCISVEKYARSYSYQRRTSSGASCRKGGSYHASTPSTLFRSSISCNPTYGKLTSGEVYFKPIYLFTKVIFFTKNKTFF